MKLHVAPWVGSGPLGSKCQDRTEIARDLLEEIPVKDKGKGEHFVVGESQTMGYGLREGKGRRNG